MKLDPSTMFIAFVCCGLATTIAVIFAVRTWFRRNQALEEELVKEAEQQEQDDAPLLASEQKSSFFAEIARPKDIRELTAVRRALAQAGQRSPEALNLYNTTRGMALVAGFAVFAFVILTMDFDFFTIVLAALAAFLGMYGPKVVLNSRIKARQERISLSLPPTLDLLVTCIEAGLSLEQALGRVAREITLSDPEMSEELSIVVGEVHAGLTIGASFKKLAERVTSDEVRNLASVIVQSSSMGASLGRTLREYAASARRRRELVLEELAGKITAGMTLPLTLCFLPAIMLMMMGPAVVLVSQLME